MNEFFSWEFLATYAGASLATGLITQFFKSHFEMLPTRMLAYFVALAVGLATLVFTGQFTAETAVLAVFNSFLVATSASGSFDFVKRMGGITHANN